jgi:RNA polymerase sigma factor (sigma-70 family)
VSHRLMDYSTDMAKISWRAVLFPADPDFVLLQRIARQDEGALEELYQKYAASLLAYLSGRLGDARLAEEVLQDVMLAAWRNAPRFRGECRVRTWLLAIAHNRAINAYHRQIRPTALETPLDDPMPIQKGEMVGKYDDLHTAIQSLPVEQRETLELVFYHGLSLQETALVLKIAPGTVKSRLHRAKARLREWINRGSEPDDLSYR